MKPSTRHIVFLLAGLGALSAALAAQDLVIYVHTPGSSSDGTVLGPTFSFPDTALGDSSAQVMRVRNTSAVSSYEVVAIYFSQPAPFVVTGTVLDKCVAPGGNEDFTAMFTPTTIGSANDTLLVASTQFSVASGCTDTGGLSSLVNWTTFSGQGLAAVIGGGGSGGIGGQPGELSLTYIATNGVINTLTSGSTFDFGRLAENQKVMQVFTLTNSSSLPLTVSTIAVSGVAFSIVGSIPTPLVISAMSSYSFSLEFAPNNPTPFTGALSIDTQTITLTGIGFEPPFPAVTLSFNVPNPW